jgi:hypothetical protein
LKFWILTTDIETLDRLWRSGGFANWEFGFAALRKLRWHLVGSAAQEVALGSGSGLTADGPSQRNESGAGMWPARLARELARAQLELAR